MKSFILNESGFTLIETLISLVITSVLTLTTVPTILRLYDYHNLNQAATVLQSDLHFIRDFNMGPLKGNTMLSIRIFTLRDQYLIDISPRGGPYKERYLPKNVTIPHGNQVIDIIFNTQGNITQGGKTLMIRSKYYSRYLVFSIGTGGFDVRD